jgi:hypothetical protein
MSLTVGPEEKITEVDLSLEGKVHNEDLSTKIYQEKIGLALQEMKPAVKEHKYTWRQQAAAWFKSSWLWRKLFGSATPTPHETSSAQEVTTTSPAQEKIKLSPEQYVQLLGKIAQKMLENDRWDHEGCFRTAGVISRVNSVELQMRESCRDEKELEFASEMLPEDYSMLFKRFVGDLGSYVDAFDKNTDAWNAVSELINKVLSSSTTKMNQENLRLSFTAVGPLLKKIYSKEPPK